jgi:mono/diheme cytochrome c family protein
MMRAVMRRAATLSALCLAALLAAGCGTQKITADASSRSGADLFAARCSGCHTLRVVGTHGSASDIRTRERNDGPNFNVRKESLQRVLYAIENGGFSGAIMPQNIVVGADAQAVAQFVAKYSGGGPGQHQAAPTSGPPAGGTAGGGGKGGTGPAPPPGGTGQPGGTGGSSGGAGGPP